MDGTCKGVPNLLSSFVDAFVDFSVTGHFLPPPQPPPENPNSGYSLSSLPAPDRLIAIGDVHGDLHKCKQSLHLAGVIDSSGDWCGGAATVVQVGDVLDRGGDEIKILYFLERLKRQAAKSGGRIVTMNGNHEIMNVDGDFRYVSKEALDEFSNWLFWYRIGNSMKNNCVGMLNCPKDPLEGVPIEFKGIKKEFHGGIRARIAALRPNGPISTRFLANNETVLVIGDSVFVHGGLLLNHVEYGLDRINEEVRDWIKGLRSNLWGDIGKGRDSLVWSRKYSDEIAKNCDCEMLEHVLATIPGAKRMIMGHTIQEGGINGVCENRGIRIDVGMSKGCIDGLPEVLEISKASGLRILTSNSLYREQFGGYDERSNQKDGLGLLLSDRGPKQVEVRS